MKEASKQPGQSGHELLKYLELRADNAVYRAGFASSRRAARQLVSHGHFKLNDKPLNIPSLRLKVGDKMTVKERSSKTDYFKRLDDVSPAPAEIPAWLKADRKKVILEVKSEPTRDNAEPDIKDQLIVEYYSR